MRIKNSRKIMIQFSFSWILREKKCVKIASDVISRLVSYFKNGDIHENKPQLDISYVSFQ